MRLFLHYFLHPSRLYWRWKLRGIVIEGDQLSPDD
jgi:hypothetical protein